MTTDLIMRVDVRTTSTTLLESLKIFFKCNNLVAVCGGRHDPGSPGDQKQHLPVDIPLYHTNRYVDNFSRTEFVSLVSSTLYVHLPFFFFAHLPSTYMHTPRVCRK